MKPAAKRPFSRDQRLTIINGMLVFVLIVVVLQLWLLTATMSAWLGGEARSSLSRWCAVASVGRCCSEAAVAGRPDGLLRFQIEVTEHHAAETSVAERRCMVPLRGGGSVPEDVLA